MMAVLFGIACPSAGTAADHRYCLAAQAESEKVLLSPVFQTDEHVAVLERDFCQVLRRDRQDTTACQCPRAATLADAEAAREHAIRYLRQSGRTPVSVSTRP